MTFERELTKDATLDNLGGFREFIEEVCDKADIPLNVKYDLVLVVDEVCTNVVTHGYEEQNKEGPISIKFTHEDDKIIVVISDKGKSFNPENAPPPELTSDWMKRPVGGLGLYFLKEIADKVAYKIEDGTNYLTMVKHLNKEAGEKAEASAGDEEEKNDNGQESSDN